MYYQVVLDSIRVLCTVYLVLRYCLLFYDTVPVPVGRTYQYHLHTMIQNQKLLP